MPLFKGRGLPLPGGARTGGFGHVLLHRPAATLGVAPGCARVVHARGGGLRRSVDGGCPGWAFRRRRHTSAARRGAQLPTPTVPTADRASALGGGPSWRRRRPRAVWPGVVSAAGTHHVRSQRPSPELTTAAVVLTTPLTTEIHHARAGTHRVRRPGGSAVACSRGEQPRSPSTVYVCLAVLRQLPAPPAPARSRRVRRGCARPGLPFPFPLVRPRFPNPPGSMRR